MLEEVLHDKTKAPPKDAAAKPVNSRYFIELHVQVDEAASRPEHDQARRAHAKEFVGIITEWLRENNMSRDVSEVAVTAMGQIMIVCARSVIDMIREQDIWAIAHIRSSDQFNQTSLMKRVGGR